MIGRGRLWNFGTVARNLGGHIQSAKDFEGEAILFEFLRLLILHYSI